MDTELNRGFLYFINQPIEILNLSTRTLRALQRNDITRIYELLNISMSDLANFERMNRQSVLETNDAMCEFGLNVGVFTKDEMWRLVPMWEPTVATAVVGGQEIATHRDIVSGDKKIKDLKFLNRYDHIDALTKLGVVRLKDLAKLTRDELFTIGGLGKVNTDKLVALLAVCGGRLREDPGSADAVVFNGSMDVVKAVSPQDNKGLWKIHLHYRLISSYAYGMLSECGIERVEQLEGIDLGHLSPTSGFRRIRLGKKSRHDIKMIADLYGLELKV